MAGRALHSLLSLLVAVAHPRRRPSRGLRQPAPRGPGSTRHSLSSSPILAPDTSGGAQLSVSGLVPGQSRTALVRVANPGSAAAFQLSTSFSDSVGAAGVPLSSVLRIEIATAGAGKALYSGPLAALQRLPLGSFADGAQRAYRFTVSLPAGAGNAVEGSALSAAFAWNAS